MSLTHVNTYLTQVQNGHAASTFSITPDWGQGRATFGGLIGGMLYTAMRREMNDARPLYSFMLSFVGPLTTLEPFTIEVTILRQGRSAVQVEGKVVQNAQVVSVALACFGTARASNVSVASLPAPSVAAPASLPELPYLPNVTPAFTQHIDFRWTFGGLPFAGVTAREMGGWMKLRDLSAGDEFTIAHLITLIDAWPPAVLPMLKSPAPASSVTWNLAFMHPMPQLNADYYLYRAHIDQAAQGYGQTHAHIWNADGALIATSSQTVAVFDGVE
ncbi:MAG: acyl-CoA thioesterase [Formosimonas sp.]